jgi:hypothetical protein
MGRSGDTGDNRRRIAVAAAVAALIAGAWLLVADGAASSASHGVGAIVTQPKTPHRGSEGAATGEVSRVKIPAANVASPQDSAPATPTRSAPATAPTAAAPTVSPRPSVAAPTTSPPSTQPPPVPSPRQAVAPRAAPSVVAQAPPGAGGVAAALIAAVNRQSGGRESIPVTSENVILLDRWMANEGGLWADNPLNTSHGAGGNPHQYTAGGEDTGIPIFSTMSAGIEANAATLLANPEYAHILHVLSRGTASCMTFANAVIRSPWASGHYDHDPAGFCSGRITPHRRTGPGHRVHSSNVRSPRARLR